VCDDEYPPRVAFSLVSPAAIAQCQDPAKVDAITKVQGDLEETIAIVHRTIDAVLDRGTKLEELVRQSEDLGYQSKLFYQNASSANRCCSLM
jgi:synaptobrevin family protein YKT6